MRLYLVRHGESVSNVDSIVQRSGSELSERGKEQARFLAARFQHISIDVILSSPLQRTKQTAEIIQGAIKKEIVLVDSLAERRQSSELFGKHVKDPEVQRVNQLWQEHAADPSWYYSDEENFSDLCVRAEQFLKFLSSRQENSILCVTHGMFLKVIVGVMWFGKQLTPQLFLALRDFLKTQNTGITVCEHNTEGKWVMKIWNDHAHLGEF